MTDLITFLKVRLDETERAVIAYRDGHLGPCLNMPGQHLDDYTPYDSCYLCIATAGATPYRDVMFGLADIEAKRAIIAAYAEAYEAYDDSTGGFQASIQYLALPFASHPDYQESWRP